jgi:hypothetical protein
MSSVLRPTVLGIVVLVLALLALAGCGRVGYAADPLDAAGLDAPAPDAAIDLDAALPDAPGLDAPFPDAPSPDAPSPDAFALDASTPDAGPPDAFALDAPRGDAGPVVTDPRCLTGTPVRFDEIGSGVSSDPYLLCNADQLDSFFASGPGTASYQLGDDIVTGSWAGRASLTGSFDGAGHEIWVTAFVTSPFVLSLVGRVTDVRFRVSVDAPSLDRVGVVAGASTGMILRVTVETDFVSGGDETGGIVGQCTGCTIDDVVVRVARISGNTRVGGVVGNMFAGSLTRARAEVSQVDARATTGCADLGGIVGTAHDGAMVDEAWARVTLLSSTPGVGGVVGDLGVGSSASDVIADGSVTVTGGAGCSWHSGGLAAHVGGTLDRGWARLTNSRSGLADRVDAGGILRDLAGVTPGLGGPEWVARTCNVASIFSGVVVLDDGTGGSGAATCSVLGLVTSTDATYFELATNPPMSSWSTMTWSFAPAAMPMLRRVRL